MPTLGATGWTRRRWPELALAVLAGLTFLGYLGAVDLWGKREQRASAEAIDTIQEGHWLIAQIQGRPRLEKPPLPRWTIAALMELTGRRDEWIVRLPGALSALGMVWLTYALARRMGGRTIALASGLMLTSSVFFIAELRQAGNDGPLAFFVTLAIYAAWRRLHPDVDEGADAGAAGEDHGSRRWNFLMYGALGLGFLTKGPIAPILVGLAVLPYLASVGRFRRGVGLLWDGWGLLLLVVLALCWPVPVLLSDPNAARIWYLEMAQKAGTAGIRNHRPRSILALEWPWMTTPWVLVACTSLALPLNRRVRGEQPWVWLAWWWTVANLVMFCFWRVAKPNYFLPCLPAVALLAGTEWVRLTALARGVGRGSMLARQMLQAHWVALFVLALTAPVVVAHYAPDVAGWVGLGSAFLGMAVVVSAWAWRRGSDVGVLAPLVAAVTVVVLIGYGRIAPSRDAEHSHRGLAARLDTLLPPEVDTVMFFHELDEGLWFYLKGRALRPVPGSQPEYNDAADLVQEAKQNRLVLDPRERLNIEKRKLLDWIAREDRDAKYLLIRNRLYDQFAPDLVGLATPVYRETGLKRNELVLLRLEPKGPAGALATEATADPSTLQR